MGAGLLLVPLNARPKVPPCKSRACVVAGVFSRSAEDRRPQPVMTVITKIKTSTPNGSASESLAGSAELLASPSQVHLMLTGASDSERLRSAWQDVVEADEALRSRVPVNGHLDAKVEVPSNGHAGGNGNGHSGVTRRAVRVPWQEYDLRGLSSTETRTWINSFLETDRSRKMLVGRAPLMRCALLRIDQQVWEFVWSFHPALDDRIRVPQIIEQFIGAYGPNLEVKQSWNGNHNKLIAAASEETPEQTANGSAVDPAVPTAGIEVNGIEDGLETKLTAVWEAVLKTTSIQLDDDFFDLGGHSLLAAPLLVRIEQGLGVELPLASLLEAPTIREQARLIRKGKIVANQPARDDRVPQLPFFFLGGDATFRPLSRRLSELREFHSLGLQASLIAKLEKRSLEAIAEQFVTMIRERRPTGPYMLGGWCAHGLLAYEVARQLKAEGQEVAQVVMLETANPVRMKRYSGWRRVIARVQLKIHLLKFERAYLRQLNGAQAKAYIAARASQKYSRIKQSLWQVFGQTVGSDNLHPLEVLYAAASRYYPRPYEGYVVLIRSLKRTFGFGRQLPLGWDDVLGKELEVCETPGNHYTIYMEPNVDTLARKMNTCLRKAEERVAQRRSAVAR